MRIYTDEHRAAYERNWWRKFWARIDQSGGPAARNAAKTQCKRAHPLSGAV